MNAIKKTVMIAVLAAVLLAAVVSVAYILKLRGEEVCMSDDKAAKLLSSASALLPDSADFVLVLNEKGSYTAVYNRTAAFTGGSGSLTGEEAENSAAKLAAAARKVISQRLYTSVNATRIFGGNEQYVQLALTDSGASLFDGCIGGYFSFEFSDGNLTSYTLSIELPDGGSTTLTAGDFNYTVSLEGTEIKYVFNDESTAQG